MVQVGEPASVRARLCPFYPERSVASHRAARVAERGWPGSRHEPGLIGDGMPGVDTHDMEVAGTADRIIRLSDGRVP